MLSLELLLKAPNYRQLSATMNTKVPEGAMWKEAFFQENCKTSCWIFVCLWETPNLSSKIDERKRQSKFTRVDPLQPQWELKEMLRESRVLWLDKEGKKTVMVNAHHPVHVGSCEALLLLIILILPFPQFRKLCVPKKLHVFTCVPRLSAWWSSYLGLG